MCDRAVAVHNRETVRRCRHEIESEIAHCDLEIASFLEWKEATGKELITRIHSAAAAAARRVELLDRIEREALWAYDYESASDYYDKKGFSRQRIHQIKLEVGWARLVVDADPSMPVPVGQMARMLGATNPDLSLKAYFKAVRDNGGDLPAYSRLLELVKASREVDVDDDLALTGWRDRQHLQAIEQHFTALSNESSRTEARKIVQSTRQD